MKKKRIYVAGHRGMVGSAICRQLSLRDDIELVVKTHKELDLTVQKDVDAFLRKRKLIRFILLRLKLVAFMPTIHFRLNSSIRIS